MDWKERAYCGEITPHHVGKDVLLMGWVDSIRDHGNLLFIHLRDVRGIVQVVFDPGVSEDSYEEATGLKEEYVLEVRGRVASRGAGTENPLLETGSIEVFAANITILAVSKALPFRISEKAMVYGEETPGSPDKVDEDLRLRYRYLDLRRPSMQDNFLKRHKIVRTIRGYLDTLGFAEIETPFLTRSTPEGARDYLIPSRIHRGRFYSLPQSPQLFKQLLMIGGMDRYFQIVKCFRDEDLRPNRQPEFTQLDLEASFIDEEFIYEIVEEMIVRMFRLGDIHLSSPFPRMTYGKAVDLYGTDRPDLRFDMAFREATDLLQDTDYAVFRRVIGNGGLIKGFCVKGEAAALSKNLLQNEYAMKIVPAFGGKGMTWMKVIGGELQSNIVQFFSASEQEGLLARFEAEEGDVIMMIADASGDRVNKVLCSLRLHVAKSLGLISDSHYTPIWVTDFPLFELKDGELSSQHHPFTMPDRTDFDPTNQEELVSLNSRAYDLVMNGEELGGGSIRIHTMEIQKKIFQALGLSRDEVEAKFGFFLGALEYGAPPHGGLALGLDRVIAMILGKPSIREVIPFPKNRRAFCPLSRTPSRVDESQLEELGLDFHGGIGRPDTSSRKAGADQGLGGPEKISKARVRHVAKLARLRLADTEIDAYQKDLNSILDYVETLRDLDTEEVHPMSHGLKLRNVLREDEPGKPRQPEEIMANAPMREKDFFRVPKIVTSQ